VNRDCIISRIDCALEKMRAREMGVRSINLTPEDWDDLNAALSAEYGSTLYTFRYAGHEIRSGNRSVIYSNHGVSVNVPKRLSRRVAA
jgi:hypothetical protein